LFGERELIKVFTAKPSGRYLKVLKGSASRDLDNIFLYRERCNLVKHTTRKDFVLLDDGREVRPSTYSSRVLVLRESPLPSCEGPIQLSL